MLQIALVADEHDDDVRVCVVTELLEPPRHVHIRRMLRDVVDKQCTDCAAVVPVVDRRKNEGRTTRMREKSALSICTLSGGS